MDGHKSHALRSICIGAVLIGFVIWLTWQRPASQSQPSGSITPVACQDALVDQYNRADVVMSGSVFMIIPSDSLAKVIIDPLKIYKGSITHHTISLMALDENSVASTGVNGGARLHFQTGQPPYLLFLRSQNDGTYITGICDGSRLLGTGLTAEESLVLEKSET